MIYTNPVDALLPLLLIGVIFFAICLVIMSVLFGLAVKDTGKKQMGLFLLLITSLSLPLVSSQISPSLRNSSQAAQNPVIVFAEAARVDDHSAVVNLNLSQSATAFVLYRAKGSDVEIPILPTATFSKSISHSFIVPLAGKSGGSIVFNIAGERILYKNLPLQIPTK